MVILCKTRYYNHTYLHYNPNAKRELDAWHPASRRPPGTDEETLSMSEESPIQRRGPDNQTWFLVATAGGDTEAAILKGALESAGIPVWAYRESAGRALGLGIGPLGATFLYTTEKFYETALDILAGPDESEALEDGDYLAGEAVTLDDEDDEDEDAPWDEDDEDEDEDDGDWDEDDEDDDF